jgi:hypothetical protein
VRTLTSGGKWDDRARRGKDVSDVAATPATWDEFKSDLRTSFKAWRVAPLLPVISLALFLTSYIPEPWSLLALPVYLFAGGWVGTERIWYLRIYRNERITAHEIWTMTWAFFWRYVRLGLLAGVLFAPILFAAFRNIANDPDDAERVLSDPALLIPITVVTIVIDFALTFVTPALAFSTERVGEALRLGFRMLRDHWPRTAWYSLVPPLAVVLMLRVSEPSSVRGVTIAAAAVSVLLNLWFKGATAAFYLRRVSVGVDGAAFSDQTDGGAPDTEMARSGFALGDTTSSPT